MATAKSNVAAFVPKFPSAIVKMQFLKYADLVMKGYGHVVGDRVWNALIPFKYTNTRLIFVYLIKTSSFEDHVD